MSRTRRRFLQAAGSTALLAVAGCAQDDGSGNETTEPGAGEEMTEGEMTEGEMTEGEMTEGEMSGATTFTVRIENVAATDTLPADTSTDGQVWITPGAYTVHTDGNPIFTTGEAASVGLEALAEAGPPTGFEGEPGLVSELEDSEDVVAVGAYTPEDTVADPNDPMGEVPGAPPIAPGGAFEFEIEAGPDQHLSFASMFVPSNDLFLAPGPEGVPTWADGEPVSGDVTDSVTLWDAGTEPNQEPGYGDAQAPAQSAPDEGDDQDGVVRPVAEVDDGYEYPAVADVVRVTLTPQESMGDGMDGETTTSG